MMISTKGRYALRVMIDLAEHNTGAYIPLLDIAKRQEISEKYLESKMCIRDSSKTCSAECGFFSRTRISPGSISVPSSARTVR